MKAQGSVSEISNKGIVRLMDSFGDENIDFIIGIYTYLRNIKKSKLKDNIVIYEKDDFKKMSWKDNAIDRIVARYDDIMLCIDVYDKYDGNLIVKNMDVFAKVIKRVAADIDLDRVMYVRIFKRGFVDESGFILTKGYCDTYREFNPDILDLLTISLEDLAKNPKSEIAPIMNIWQ